MIRKRGSWGEGELYEALCLLMICGCLWIIGIQFQVFSSLNAFIHANDLSNAFMLVALMGLAVFAASLRKSLLLRVAMRERDITAAEAEAVARHDVLTGLANRRLFLETLERRRAAASLVPTQAVLLVDLDRFKPVNDIYGHAAGNAVLCAVAERLSALTPEGGLAARLGGDEFALLVPLDGGSDGLSRLAQAVIASIAAPIQWQGNELKVGATIGIALISADQADADVVLHAADLAMYQGKKDGRGVFRVFKSAMDLELKARAQLESELREAIANGEIEPFYQPVVTLPEKTLVGVEVLARWRHPVRGLLAPASFIGIAEETGLISELSMKLLRQACLDARDWPSHFQLAVNIAPQQFQDRWLCERILAILTETGFSPSRLEVEITETALVQDLEAARTTLTSLQNLGVRIALDDFGTGYSSLYHLRELKFDKLKIDRTYVDTITMSAERAKLVDAIIKLGASLGLVTTAEGIETDASVDWLSDQGCDYGQGYLFGAPMPKEAITALIGAPVEEIQAKALALQAA
ncbi:putative signaling protein [Methylobacterium cerastii]|uniref:Signaling protein n=1 Tax=Methylobacterium cerastii TaxID=932741 RepID=A0ABQ4QN67_9HYPH|nr:MULTISPECIES: EAL domain-containing protein [Methylobacterium]TXM62259.1 EAL domain-containing protein [Methylobacterium sp. WL120]TXM74413.1 EAL domain-containing protein [Methylobacterium sp. WL12]TXN79252.1 EAL domain-containing protein [Methylobacterium sp. WL8]GJD46282.1 putative signaling protein [Methylobacterium cerastii]